MADILISREISQLWYVQNGLKGEMIRFFSKWIDGFDLMCQMFDPFSFFYLGFEMKCGVWFCPAKEWVFVWCVVWFFVKVIYEI